MSDCYLHTKWQAVKPIPSLLHGTIFRQYLERSMLRSVNRLDANLCLINLYKSSKLQSFEGKTLSQHVEIYTKRMKIKVFKFACKYLYLFVVLTIAFDF